MVAVVVCRVQVGPAGLSCQRRPGGWHSSTAARAASPQPAGGGASACPPGRPGLPPQDGQRLLCGHAVLGERLQQPLQDSLQPGAHLDCRQGDGQSWSSGTAGRPS